MSFPAAQQNVDIPAYSTGAKLLHWLVAALLAAQFAVAWIMPDIHRGTPQGGLIDLHLSLGALILLLVVLRTALRFSEPGRPAAAGRGLLQRLAAIIHLVLYLLLLVLPLLGWANAGSRGWTVSLFGLVPLPAILPSGSPIGPLLGDLHSLLATLLLVGAGLHVAAVLYHQVWLRQPLLQRMLPLPRSAAAPRVAGARR